VNQSCLPSCPYRGHHLNTSSLASQPDAPCPTFEYPLLECGLEYVRDPSKIISGIFVRPEDLAVYEEFGVSRFKISGRNRSTEWLAKVATAYASRSYSGNLAEILSLVQVKGPRSALREVVEATGEADAQTLAAAFEPFGDICIDNRAFPPDFLRHIVAVDCERTTCTACGYCRGVAEKVLRISGVPPSGYHPPSDLPSPLHLISRFGPRADSFRPKSARLAVTPR